MSPIPGETCSDSGTLLRMAPLQTMGALQHVRSSHWIAHFGIAATHEITAGRHPWDTCNPRHRRHLWNRQ